jgi:hypothetical protein
VTVKRRSSMFMSASLLGHVVWTRAATCADVLDCFPSGRTALEIMVTDDRGTCD